jgi:hypothetical protein
MPILLAWLVGEGIIVYRWTKQKAPPPPGALAVASLLYLGAAVVAEYGPARNVAIAWAWAVDVAVLMNVLPGGKDAKNGVTTNWPPPYIPCGQILPSSGTGVTGKPDCSPAAASSSSSSSTASAITSTGTKVGKSVASGLWNAIKP